MSIHSAAETLLIFLESLREPVVPFSLFHRSQLAVGLTVSPEIGLTKNTAVDTDIVPLFC